MKKEKLVVSTGWSNIYAQWVFPVSSFSKQFSLECNQICFKNYVL